MANRKQIDLSQVEALAGRGLTHAEICDVMGFSERTFYARKRESADFADAIKRGRSKAHAVISNSLFELAKGGNLGAIIWYEKTRCGMSDKQVITHQMERIEIEGFDYTKSIAALAPSKIEE